MRVRRSVMVVDADPALRRSLAEQLAQHREFASCLSEDGAAAMALLHRKRFDAAVLDLRLPDMDGRELCRAMRQAGFTAPIILLTGGDGEVDASALADIGATDQIAKPFRLGALLARLRANLNEGGNENGATLTIGPYSFDPTAKLMSEERGGRMVRLTEKEAAILQFLYRAGRAIDRDALLGQIWGYNDRVTTHTLETHIYRLRRKIERDPARAEILVTEPGGYRLLP